MKKRIYQIAQELGKENQEVLQVAQKLGLSVTTPSSGLTESESDRVVQFLTPQKRVSKEKSKQHSSRKEVNSPQKQKSTTNQLREELARYEKKPTKKSKPPQVKTVSQKQANRWFVFFLVFFSVILLSMGGIGIVSNLRMNQLVKDTNLAMKHLEAENQKQNQEISDLQKLGQTP